MSKTMGPLSSQGSFWRAFVPYTQVSILVEVEVLQHENPICFTMRTEHSQMVCTIFPCSPYQQSLLITFLPGSSNQFSYHSEMLKF